MTFQEIVAEVQHGLARSDAVVVDKIPSWVNRRQKMAASRHNFSFMRTENQFSTVPGLQEYDLPSDYKDDILFYLLLDDRYVLIPIVSDRTVLDRYSPTDSGQPKCLTMGNGKVKLWPPLPDDTYTIRRLYYAWPADLSGISTNWFTDHGGQMLVSGGVAEGLWFLGANEEVPGWEMRYESELKRLITQDAARGLPQEFVLVPRRDIGRTGSTIRQDAGWPW